MKKLPRLDAPLSTILLPYSEKLGDPKPIYNGIIKALEEGTKFTDVCLSTNKVKDFEQATKALNL